jgi:hypothetical protein
MNAEEVANQCMRQVILASAAMNDGCVIVAIEWAA